MPAPSEKAVKQPLKWHGGKFYLSKWLHELAAPHTHRVYLYAGGLGEMWNWPHAGVSEVANDLNGYLVNFYKVLQRIDLFKKFKRQVEAVPFSREHWIDAHILMKEYMRAEPPETFSSEPDVNLAVAFFIWNRQSMAGRMTSFSPFTKSRTRGGRNAEVNAWWTGIDGLCEVRTRLDNLAIEHDDALKVLKREDRKDTLFYADPTYLVSDEKGVGRSSPDVYACENSVAHHEELLRLLTKGIKGKMMLSGYRSKLYDKYLTPKAGWKRHDKVIDNKAQKGDVKRSMTESVWTNY